LAGPIVDGGAKNDRRRRRVRRLLLRVSHVSQRQQRGQEAGARCR